MIDIHSHILYGIDDGSKSIEESVKMINEAKEAGFTTIISTSHYIEESYNADKNKRQELIETLKENVEGIEIYNGAEAYVSKNMCKLIKQGILPTLSNSKYLLFELPMNSRILNLDDIIYDLMSDKIVPIIAHPERYSYVQQDPNVLIDLINKGVLFQCNYASIDGKYGIAPKKTMKKLLKHNMVHFLGTDTHRQNSIYTHIPEICKKIEKIIGKEKLMELSTYNPSKILKNEDIEIEKDIKIKKFII